MKMIEYMLAGRTFHLCLNGQALFDAYEKFGYDEFLTKHIEGVSKESFDALCWLLFKLSEQGELVRRWQGFDHGSIAPEQFFRANLKPLEIQAAKDAVLRAVLLGFECEEKSKRRRDVFEEEFRKKAESETTT